MGTTIDSPFPLLMSRMVWRTAADSKSDVSSPTRSPEADAMAKP
jgi:hypothetical protein